MKLAAPKLFATGFQSLAVMKPIPNCEKAAPERWKTTYAIATMTATAIAPAAPESQRSRGSPTRSAMLRRPGKAAATLASNLAERLLVVGYDLLWQGSVAEAVRERLPGAERVGDELLQRAGLRGRRRDDHVGERRVRPGVRGRGRRIDDRDAAWRDRAGGCRGRVDGRDRRLRVVAGGVLLERVVEPVRVHVGDRQVTNRSVGRRDRRADAVGEIGRAHV